MRGFTFSQLAVILLVVLGLTVAVVIAATQLSKSGSQLSQIGSQVGSQTATVSNLGLTCLSNGGFCATTCTAYLDASTVAKQQQDCSTGKKCCVK